MWRPKMRRTPFERAMMTPGQQLMEENRRRASQRALDGIKEAEARKAVEGDTDANHDNEEPPHGSDDRRQ